LIFAGSKHRKDRFFKGEQAFTMLKHGFAALMILHDAETPLCSTVYFSDAETPLCSTVHFSDAETPLKNTGDHFPDAETSLIGTFISSQSQKHPIPPSFSLPKQLRPALVSLFPSSAATPFAATFPVAETPIVSNFPSVSPMLKHHCSAFFIPFHHLFHPPHRRNNSVQQLFRLFAETPSFSTSFIHVAQTPFPSNLPSFIHNAETPSFSTL
jgi:hypothetical protein